MLSETEAALHAHLAATEAARDDLRKAAKEARQAIHDLCLERGSTDGYAAIFARLNEVLDA